MSNCDIKNKKGACQIEYSIITRKKFTLPTYPLLNEIFLDCKGFGVGVMTWLRVLTYDKF
jgi:hypothetical protein